MATLGGQRTQFTWALNQCNTHDDPADREKFVRITAKYIRNAPANGFTVEQVTQGQDYPDDKVNAVVNEPETEAAPDLSEAQAKLSLEQSVDVSNVVRQGSGSGNVYAYGYKCAPDHLKIGSTELDTVQRIAAQISTSTPDKPVLFLEIKTEKCRVLERALHAILEYRGKKIMGGGAEWFLTTVEEVRSISEAISA